MLQYAGEIKILMTHSWNFSLRNKVLTYLEMLSILSIWCFLSIAEHLVLFGEHVEAMLGETGPGTLVCLNQAPRPRCLAGIPDHHRTSKMEGDGQSRWSQTYYSWELCFHPEGMIAIPVHAISRDTFLL